MPWQASAICGVTQGVEPCAPHFSPSSGFVNGSREFKRGDTNQSTGERNLGNVWGQAWWGIEGLPEYLEEFFAAGRGRECSVADRRFRSGYPETQSLSETYKRIAAQRFSPVIRREVLHHKKPTSKRVGDGSAIVNYANEPSWLHLHWM